ncbi:MAG: ABC transporter permease, partial [Bacteroidales bacterium]|nr:ABC transporter permease [Bacteroidales bacterium]
VEGEMLNESHTQTDVVMSESLVKAFGWDHGVGNFYFDNDGIDPQIKYTVVGVCKDLYTLSPTTPAENVLFRKMQSSVRFFSPGIPILLKYQEGRWAECKKAIERIAGDKLMRIENTDEGYKRVLKSENSLLMLLEIISAVCVLIAVFGIYSLVTLSCEQRQKEIAIRKVNGATVKDILDIFFKEYMLLLGISSLVALPVGTIIMKRWIEAYVLRTSLSAWIYIVILMGTALIIALSIFRIVLKAARQNPATIIRTE